jgi:hypothetical protein
MGMPCDVGCKVLKPKWGDIQATTRGDFAAVVWKDKIEVLNNFTVWPY